jgi:predicted SAM-dependent methyltransferase
MKPSRSEMKLHLGCGKRYIPGFVHIDLADFPHIDFKQSVDKLPNFRANSVDLIYSSHTFEYFDRMQGEDVLREWRRVLKPGGILRLAVPDFEALAKVYSQYRNLDLIHGPLYGRMVVRSGTKDLILFHRTCYDFKSLSRILKKCGFRNVHRYDWRDTLHKDYDDFSQAYVPHMEKQTGLLISLNVEATKG